MLRDLSVHSLFLKGYFAYFFSFESTVDGLNCQNVYDGEDGSQVTVAFFCLIGRSTVNWIIKFLYLSTLGSLFGRFVHGLVHVSDFSSFVMLTFVGGLIRNIHNIPISVLWIVWGCR